MSQEGIVTVFSYISQWKPESALKETMTYNKTMNASWQYKMKTKTK